MISPTIVDFFMDLEDQQQQKSAFFKYFDTFF